ncbi:MAG: hypothetical protein C0391_04155 [Anaerolinea sp.]|nr:hypothetical protein [Anaerolinea sp.]
MTTDRPGSQNLSILQFVFSGLGLLFLLGLAFASLVGGVMQTLGTSKPVDGSQQFLLALDLTLASLLLIPSFVISLARLIKHPVSLYMPPTPGWALAIILLWPPLLLLADWLLNYGGWTQYLFGLVRFLSAVLLAYWIFLVAGYRLPRTSSQRNWGLLTASLMGGPLLSAVVEAALGILLFIGFLVLILLSPKLADEMNVLATRISTAGGDIDSLKRILLPYASRPGVIVALLFGFSILIPLIEEAIKPIGLWFLARRKLTPAQGFLGGVISGAGFAIVENLFSSNQVLGESWLLVTSARFGTTIIHMLAAGLTGWGLTSVWDGRSYLKLAGAYLAAVMLHGIWNGMALFLGIEMLKQSELTPGIIALMIGLTAWALIALGLLLRMNTRLRKEKLLTA